ncbi:MAG TPA: hypothetical protein VF598_03945 [Hymenobacter sp.]|jgi:hypothetical protein
MTTVAATARKFNMSQIAKAAWKAVKEFGKTLSEGMKAAWTLAKAPTKMTPEEAFEQLAATDPSRFAKGKHDAYHAYFPYGSNLWEANRVAHAYADQLRQMDGVYYAGVKSYYGVEGNVVYATLDSFRVEVVEPNEKKKAEQLAEMEAAYQVRKTQNEAALAEAKRTGKTVFIREYTRHEDGDFVYCKDFAKADGLVVTSSFSDGNG